MEARIMNPGRHLSSASRLAILRFMTGPGLPSVLTGKSQFLERGV